MNGKKEQAGIFYKLLIKFEVTDLDGKVIRSIKSKELEALAKDTSALRNSFEHLRKFVTLQEINKGVTIYKGRDAILTSEV